MARTEFSNEQILDGGVQKQDLANNIIDVNKLDTNNTPTNKQILSFNASGNYLEFVVPGFFVITPTNVSPVDLEQNFPTTSGMLTSSNFDGVGVHTSSQYQITLTSDTNWTSLFEDSGEIIATTTYNIVGTLTDTYNYKWRVRYKDNVNNWSNWSSSTSFTTVSAISIYTNQTTALVDKCIFYCELDTVTPTVDKMGNLTNGTLGTGCTTGFTGKLGQAVDFDGTTSAYIQFTEIQSLFANNDFSLCAWFWVDVLDSTGNCIVGIDNGSATDQFYIRTYNSLMRMYPKGTTMESVTALNTTGWHHIVFTYNGTTGIANFYLDGVLDKSQTITGWTVGTGIAAYPLYIGMRQQTNFAAADGRIDSVAIWNRELAASGAGTDVADVAKLYNTGSGALLF